ncbi:MAG TPA: hypothetical protein VHX62_17875 [Solirubrobacteraceae bacterium]|jgi:hypothetical protein|nr:hypothetical protein [Solirubrobacteraceae bacterium]
MSEIPVTHFESAATGRGAAAIRRGVHAFVAAHVIDSGTGEEIDRRVEQMLSLASAHARSAATGARIVLVADVTADDLQIVLRAVPEQGGASGRDAMQPLGGLEFWVSFRRC